MSVLIEKVTDIDDLYPDDVAEQVGADLMEQYKSHDLIIGVCI